MSQAGVLSRYVTPDFSTAPLAALADLMGLKRFSPEILAKPEIYGPILTGIATFRHLPTAQQMQIQRSIVTNAPGVMIAPLRTLISDLSVQRYWYMWSLSDEELKEFYQFSRRKAEVTDQYDVIALPSPTVATLAGAVYAVADKGLRAHASNIVSSTLRAPIVQETARKLGLSTARAEVAGAIAVPTLICISVVNFMALKESGKARRELAARGLLAYSDL
ncbi:hypothetical protein [Marinobacter sp.]|uniref:hypothetical protein n=1 Tax=Marinobacter sp. TaxID=50741 RepID=UPI00384F96D5